MLELLLAWLSSLSQLGFDLFFIGKRNSVDVLIVTLIYGSSLVIGGAPYGNSKATVY